MGIAYNNKMLSKVDWCSERVEHNSERQSLNNLVQWAGINFNFLAAVFVSRNICKTAKKSFGKCMYDSLDYIFPLDLSWR